MSVSTECEEKVDAVRKNVHEAIEALGCIVVNRCWGTDDMAPVTFAKYQKTLDELITIRERIGCP